MGRTFALADLHGQGRLWDQIKAFLKPDDKLIFLGDAIDRGPDGYHIMRDMLTDNRVIYIKGNHEYMAVDALRDCAEYEALCRTEDTCLWDYNGGGPTFNAIEAHGAHYAGWANLLDQLPAEVEYENENGVQIILCHAGFTPGKKPDDEYDMVWNRHHIPDKIPKKFKDDPITIIHGHTPTPHLIKTLKANKASFTEDDGVVYYGDGHKIDLDCGCFATGHIVLLDLNTWEQIAFDATPER